MNFRILLILLLLFSSFSMLFAFGLKDTIQEKVDQALLIMTQNINNWGKGVEIEKAQILEKEINEIRSQLRRNHLVNLEKQKYDYTSGLIYYNIFIYFERSADHIINVSEALTGQVA